MISSATRKNACSCKQEKDSNETTNDIEIMHPHKGKGVIAPDFCKQYHKIHYI